MELAEVGFEPTPFRTGALNRSATLPHPEFIHEYRALACSEWESDKHLTFI